MAFANLFTNMPAIDDVRDSVQQVSAHRDVTDGGKRGNGRKRKIQGGQKRPFNKKKCYLNPTSNDGQSFNNDSMNNYQHVWNSYSESASAGWPKDVIYYNSSKDGHRKGPNNKKLKYHEYRKKQQGQEKNREWQKEKRRTAHQGGKKAGELRMSKYGKKNSDVPRERFMTKEFIEQNALSVNGRLICRFFVWGKCIKGEECQLEHVEGYNDLVKQACKFYIQGTCIKGERCPYMHKSFPCKFFHRKGKCFQGEDCRFSHEALDEVTNKLLEEAINRDTDLEKLAKKTEQQMSGQPVSAEEPENKETDKTDTLLQPLRLNFYQSVETNADKESKLLQTEVNVEEAVAPHVSDDARSHSPPSTNFCDDRPVCYSVEAVLGPQLSKSFPSLFSALRNQESAPVSIVDSTSGCANQSSSVEDNVRSLKSVKTPPGPSARNGLQKNDFGPQSFKPCYYTSSLTKLSDKAVVHSESISGSVKSSDSANSVSFQEQTAKQTTESHLHAKETIAGGGSKRGHRGGLAVESKETTKTPFNCLFANITDSLLPKDDSVASGSMKSSCAVTKSEDFKKTVETHKYSSKTFVGLFSAPLSLSPAPRPCTESQTDCTRTSSGSEKPTLLADTSSHSSNSKPTAAYSEKPLQCQTRSNVKEIPHVSKVSHFCPDPERDNKGNKNQQVDPTFSLESGFKSERFTCSTPAVTGQTTTHAPQLQPDISCCKEDAGKSVFRTLFQRLSPYQEDREEQDGVHIGILSESEEKDTNSTEFLFEKKQLNSETRGTRKKIKTPKCSEMTDKQPSLQSPHVPSEAAADWTLGCVGMTEPQGRNSGTNYLSSKMKMKHHNEARLKNQKKTPFKDLFKSFEMTSFPSGN